MEKTIHLGLLILFSIVTQEISTISEHSKYINKMYRLVFRYPTALGKGFLQYFLSVLYVLYFLVSEKSSEFHIRTKRIVDRTHYGNRQATLRQFPYIVNILENGKCECAGSILSPTIIITAAHCVFENGSTYSILTNSPSSDRGITYNVTKKILHPLFDRQQVINDLALLVIHPAINFYISRNEPIKLYTGHLPRNPMGTACGWGCNYRRG